ncbi:MAG: FAD-dependent oxidoreductase [Acidobacteriota bacterium]
MEKRSEVKTVRIVVDDRALDVPEGTSVASAVYGLNAARTSVRGEDRQALCGMGICFECRLTVDGQPHRRTCQLPVRDGLHVEAADPETDALTPGRGPDPEGSAALEAPAPLDATAFDVVVLGGGPAGLAAAVSAGELGRTVAIIDDNPGFGGQIWRGQSSDGAHESAAASPSAPLRRRLHALVLIGAVAPFPASSLIDAASPKDFDDLDDARPQSFALTVKSPAGVRRIRASALVLATGARELFLPFPGWTRPGVLGAGGLQAMIKAGLDIRGQRVLIAGSGPLLLAVADLVRRHGGDVIRIVEQASAASVARFGAGLLTSPGKLAQAATLAASLLRTPKTYGTWPTEARGRADGRLGLVMLSNGDSLECDLLACGFGLVPNTGVARHLGASLAATDLGHTAIVVDGEQRTSRPGLFAAGECTGVGGVDAAVLEGEIAGRAAAGASPDLRLAAKRRRSQAFARRLDVTFQLDPRLRDLPRPDTIVCRCEDVPWRALSRYGPGESRRAKLETRCGMGPCQGRVCGAATAFLLGFGPDRIRPPFFPAAIDDLMAPEP